MDTEAEKPEKLRERLQQEEIKMNPFGSFSDGFRRAESGSFLDLFAAIGWKATGFIILLIIVGFIIYMLY